METRSSSDRRELRPWGKTRVRATCFALTCALGLVCCPWNLEYNCTLFGASLIILALAYVCNFRRFAKTQNDDPTDREVVLVTGCDSGLGYSLALHLRSIGFRVIAAVHTTKSSGARELSALSGIFVHPLEITSCESVTAFCRAARDHIEQRGLVLRAFVNNAGAMIFGEFEWQTEEQTRHQIEVNLLGTMRVTRAFMPTIRTHLSRLIVVTSHCASEPLPGVATYGATKAALSAWATALRVELKKYRVDVVSFVPGSFIRESNLFSQQRRHFEAMESAMSEETRSFYGDYFTRYADYLSNLAPANLPLKLENPRIYEVFEDALLDRHPRAVYKCEPWRYTLYHTLFKIAPLSLRDRLVERFVQLPAWKTSESSEVMQQEQKTRDAA